MESSALRHQRCGPLLRSHGLRLPAEPRQHVSQQLDASLCVHHMTCPTDPKYQRSPRGSVRIVEQPHVVAYHNRLLIALIILGYIIRRTSMHAFPASECKSDRLPPFCRTCGFSICLARARRSPACLQDGFSIYCYIFGT